MTETPLIPLYDDDNSFRATFGAPLFDSDQAMRAYTSGERKRALMEAGLVFVVRKRLVTDAPQALFNAFVTMKKDDSRLRARAMPDAAPVEPVKPRDARVSVTTLHVDATEPNEIETQ